MRPRPQRPDQKTGEWQIVVSRQAAPSIPPPRVSPRSRAITGWVRVSSRPLCRPRLATWSKIMKPRVSSGATIATGGQRTRRGLRSECDRQPGEVCLISQSGGYQPNDPVLRLYQARLMGDGTYRAVRPLAPEGQRDMVFHSLPALDGCAASTKRAMPHLHVLAHRRLVGRADEMSECPLPQAGVDQSLPRPGAWPEGMSR
jgi:hypothetical protein